MIGAIVGDVIGSVYEVIPVKYKDFNLFHSGSGFTDDTVLTIAVADYLQNGGNLVDLFHEYYSKYPKVGYGKTFAAWAKVKDKDPYNSWGNGSAMRVSPVAWAFDDLPKIIEMAGVTAAVTHNHEDGILAAQAVAGAIYMARTGSSKLEIKKFCQDIGKYNLDKSLDEIRPNYKFEVYAIYSVPEAIIAFLESNSFEDAIRNAISLGGDADTQACIAGSIAEAFYGGVPDQLKLESMNRLDSYLSDKVISFYDHYIKNKYI